MERARLNSVLLGVCSVLLAGNVMVSFRGEPASAQTTQNVAARGEMAQYKVAPSNLGVDLEERINAMAARGWRLKQVIYGNGTSTNWVIYEK